MQCLQKLMRSLIEPQISALLIKIPSDQCSIDGIQTAIILKLIPTQLSKTFIVSNLFVKTQ